MSDDDTLMKMQLAVRKFCTDREWDQFHNPKDMALSLTLEATEVLEHFQWKNEQEIKEYLAQHKSEVADEIIDVLYWVLRMSDRLDIDLKAAFEKKMNENNEKYPVHKARGNHKKHTEHQEN